MKKILILLFLIIICFWSNAAIYYIDSSVTDVNVASATADYTTYNPATFTTTGGISSVFKTIADVNAKTKSAGDQYLFRKGQSWYGTVSISQSGASGNVITLGAYGTGANPIITGFTTITSGWTDEGSGIYSKIITSETQTNMVTIDGIQYGMGRYPNTAYLVAESSLTNVSITDNDLPDSPNWTGAESVIVKTSWILDRCIITNHTSHTITYTTLGSDGYADATSPYFIQNDLRTLDQFGEWYHNQTTGKFYMYFGAISPTTKTVNVATLSNLIKTTGNYNYLTINNISFIGSINNNVSFAFANSNVTIQNCTINNSGLNAIESSGAFILVDSNSINDCNRNAIHSDGGNVTITNNTITNAEFIVGQGNVWLAYVGAIFIYGDICSIQNNIIQNTGYNGIFLSSNVASGTIKNNFIYNTCQILSDQGAFYTDAAHTAISVDGNVIIKSGGEGIYLDEQSTNVTVKNNTVSECNGAGIKLHRAHNNSILDNTSFNNATQILFLNWEDANNIHDIVSSGNIFVAKTSTQIVLDYTTIYSGFAATFSTLSFDNNYYARPIADNTSIYWTTPSNYGNKTLAEWKTFTGKDASSNKSPYIITDPDELYLAYNATSSTSNVSLPAKYKDLSGNEYNGTISLGEFASKVLYYVGETTAPTTRTKGISAGNGKIWGIGSVCYGL